MSDRYFLLAGIVFLLVHELDAIRCNEWRLIPGLSSLKELTARMVFIVVHIPLVYGLLWYISASPKHLYFETAFKLFLVLHLVIHLTYARHKHNGFKDFLSWFLIVSAGICGFFGLIC